MKDLYRAGYGFEIHTAAVRTAGVKNMTFFGIACPLWWIFPGWGMEEIFKRGNFSTSERPVIAQEATIDDLLAKLLVESIKMFPEPYLLPTGRDAREVWPEIYCK